MGKKILVISMLFCLSLTALAQKRIELTSNVAYREGASKSWVLDIANPLDADQGSLRPAIVIIHGRGWSAGSKTDLVYRNLLIDYALQGYVTLSVEYRFNQEAPFPACIQDVKCAIRWIYIRRCYI